MIFCNECGMKAPQHKLSCSQVGGTGATARNAYTDRSSEPIISIVNDVVPLTLEFIDDMSTSYVTQDTSSSTNTISDSIGE